MAPNEKIPAFEEFEQQLRSAWQKYHHYIIPTDSRLSPVQLYLLRFLHKRGFCKTSDIAREFGITLGAVTGLIDRLLGLNLVARKHSKEDRRLVLVELTKAGEKTVKSFESQRQQKFMAIASALEEADLKQLIHLLGKLNRILDELNKKQPGE